MDRVALVYVKGSSRFRCNTYSCDLDSMLLLNRSKRAFLLSSFLSVSCRIGLSLPTLWDTLLLSLVRLLFLLMMVLSSAFSFLARLRWSYDR